MGFQPIFPFSLDEMYYFNTLQRGTVKDKDDEILQWIYLE